MRPLGVVAVIVTLLAGGCAGADEPKVPPVTAPDAFPPHAVVLRVADTGGFTSPIVLLTRVPVISVYGDGLVITQGPQVNDYPGRTLPRVEQRRISPAGVARLVRLALDAGAGSGADTGRPQITDHTTTRFTVLTGAGVRSTDVYALIERDAGGVTRAQEAVRAELRLLRDKLANLPGTLGADATDPAVEYQPSALAVIVRRWEPSAGGGPTVRAWPGPALPGTPINGQPALTCTVVTGDAVRTVSEAARDADATTLSRGGDATAATSWQAGDERWLVHVHPLLPDESDCADLTTG